jgi:hypothetical protein
VNFNTTVDDIEALPAIVVRLGQQVHAELRPNRSPVEMQDESAAP